MIGLFAAASSGFLISWFFGVGMLVAASAAFFVVDVWRIQSNAAVAIDDVLMLFAYLSVLQGGFLIGAYIKHSRTDEDRL
jgi:hypothetical protein